MAVSAELNDDMELPGFAFYFVLQCRSVFLLPTLNVHSLPACAGVQMAPIPLWFSVMVSITESFPDTGDHYTYLLV